MLQFLGVPHQLTTIVGVPGAVMQDSQPELRAEVYRISSGRIIVRTLGISRSHFATYLRRVWGTGPLVKAMGSCFHLQWANLGSTGMRQKLLAAPGREPTAKQHGDISLA